MRSTRFMLPANIPVSRWSAFNVTDIMTRVPDVLARGPGNGERAVGNLSSSASSTSYFFDVAEEEPPHL